MLFTSIKIILLIIIDLVAISKAVNKTV
jgi:hypothetical protein